MTTPGPLANTAQTNVPGIQIGELLPQLSQLADKYSLIRSFTHGQNGHETASYLTQTGRMPGRIVFPAAGAVVTAFKGFAETPDDAKQESLIPPYVVLTSPQGRFSEAGFMGVKYRPFATGGDPNAARFAVEGDHRSRPHRRSTARATSAARTAQHPQKGPHRRKPNWPSRPSPANTPTTSCSVMPAMSSTSTRSPSELRLKYGRTKFGQSCLAARRLIEQGTKFVTINHGGWDTHKDHFPSMRRKLPELDQGLAALIADLDERGLLDQTIVWCIGEFGRTPKVANESPWNGGRHHFGSVFSTLVAGGGFQGGQVVGESDARGERVKDRPVYPGDLIGTMYELLGIDPEASLPHPRGDFIRATPSEDEGIQSGGRLSEIVSA